MIIQAKVDNPQLYLTFHEIWDFPNGSIDVKEGFTFEGDVSSKEIVEGVNRYVIKTDYFIPFPYIHIDSDSWNVLV